MELKTFDVVIEGVRSQEKAHSLRDLLAQFEMMGIDKGNIKILAEINSAGKQVAINQPKQTIPGQLTTQEQETGNMTMIDINDIPEDMRKAVALELDKKTAEAVVNERRVNVSEPGALSNPVFVPAVPVKIWKDCGTEYKLDNNKLYKREWTKINLTGLEAKGIRIRIKDDDDNKLKAKEFTIEIQDWQEIKQS